jgi:hypothetical protein
MMSFKTRPLATRLNLIEFLRFCAYKCVCSLIRSLRAGFPSLLLPELLLSFRAHVVAWVIYWVSKFSSQKAKQQNVLRELAPLQIQHLMQPRKSFNTANLEFPGPNNLPYKEDGEQTLEQSYLMYSSCWATREAGCMGDWPKRSRSSINCRWNSAWADN